MKYTCAAIAMAVLIIDVIPAPAIVIRNDVPDARYKVASSEIPQLVDLPNEGHGILIAKRWVVTVGHAVRWGTPKQVTVSGEQGKVAAMIVHPGFRMPPDQLVSMTGDAAPLMPALAASDDIALLELVELVEDVVPMPLYKGPDEQGQVVKIYGKGATANGLTGQYPNSPDRRDLRRAYNRITSVDERWIGYRFDAGTEALPLEGMLGDGDSGGPVVMESNGTHVLVGLSDRESWKGDLIYVPCGRL